MYTKKKENVAHSNFKIYYKSIIIKTKQNKKCDKDRHTNKWNGTESLEIYIHIDDQMIFDKGTRTIH